MATITKIVTIIAWLTISVSGQSPYAYETSSQPAAYTYDWRVQDAYSANDFGQEEARSGYNIDGGYSVLLPDGRKQIVTYKVADAYSGYVADVRYEGEAQYAPYQPPAPGAVPFTVHNGGAYKSYTPAPAPRAHTTFAAAPAAPYVPHAAPSYNVPRIAPAYPTTHYRPHHPKSYYPTAPAYPVHPTAAPYTHKYNFKPVVITTAAPVVVESTPAPAPATTTLAPKKVVTETTRTPVYIPSYKRPKTQYAANRLDDVINGSLFYSDLGRIKAENKPKSKDHSHIPRKEHGHNLYY